MSYPRLILVMLFLFPAVTPAVAGSIVLRFEDARFESNDVLYIELYILSGSEIRWADLEVLEAIRQIRLAAPIDKILVMEDLPAGRYAARGYIDEDVNKELTLKSNGRPAEPFGFSLTEGRRRPSLRLRHAVFELNESTDESENSVEVRFVMMGRRSP